MSRPSAAAGSIRAAVAVAVGVVAATGIVAACSPRDEARDEARTDEARTDEASRANADVARSGGDGTVFDEGPDAFGQSMPTLDALERRRFVVGNSFFRQNWVTAPASTTARDGLGPLDNAQSCSSCHVFDGRAAPPLTDDDPERGLLLRLSRLGDDGSVEPDPSYGGQLQDRAINGVEPEGRIVISRSTVDGSFDDGTPFTLESPSYRIDDLAYGPLSPRSLLSPRIAPPMFGVGLLEAVPVATLDEFADPDDEDGDGVSGRVNRVTGGDGEPAVGRFGWKANVASVLEQNAGAFVGDLGITTALHPDESCTLVQLACNGAPAGGRPEIDEDTLAAVTFYARTLAVPARRDVGASDTMAGESIFGELGCSSCHVPEVATGPSDVEALAFQTIRPYTDLLVHDMGQGLADGRPDGEATGSEWRTAPLWGIGLTEEVNGHTRFLHDGRARNLEEAVLWHGGEAAASQRAYRALSADERRQVVAFLESL